MFYFFKYQSYCLLDRYANTDGELFFVCFVYRKYKRYTVSLRKELTALQTSRDVFKRRATRATNLCRKMAVVLDQVAGDDRIQSLKSEAAVILICIHMSL